MHKPDDYFDFRNKTQNTKLQLDNSHNSLITKIKIQAIFQTLHKKLKTITSIIT